MKSKFLFGLVALLTVVALTITLNSGTPNAKAADIIKSKNFTGFDFEKATLKSSMKKQIKAWVEATAVEGFTMVSCTGYTGFNANRREAEFLQTLAETRSRNICDYIHTLKNIISIYSIEGIPGDGKSASARKVTVRLIKPDGGDSGGGTDGGGGDVVIGVCDNALTVTMQSRIVTGNFYFSTITVKDISSNCRSNVLDIYLLDEDGNQLAVSSGNIISTTSRTFSYTQFNPTGVLSNQIKKVAFEFRAP